MSQNLISSRSVAVALRPSRRRIRSNRRGGCPAQTDRQTECAVGLQLKLGKASAEKWRQIEVRQDNSLGSASKPIGNRGEPYAC